MSDIGKKVSNIESSIPDLLSAVNILERDIANFANISFSSQGKSNIDLKSCSSKTSHSLSSHTQTSPTNITHVRFTASASSSSTHKRPNHNTRPSTASSSTSTLPQGLTQPVTHSSILSHHRARTAPFNPSSTISTQPKKSLLIKCFQMFMNKIEQIQKVSPSSKLIVSPILPTAIPLLNAKAVHFNARLFSVPRQWLILYFSVFADRNNTL